MPEVPLGLQRQPDLGVPACQGFKQKRGICTHGPAPFDDGIEALEGDFHSSRRLGLRHTERLEKLPQQHLAGMRGRTMGRQHRKYSSVVVGAAHVESVFSLEPEDDPTLLVYANRVKTGKIIYQPVQPIPRWDPQVVEFGHRIDLIQLALNDRPDRSRNPSGGFAIDAVPDVPGRVISERPDHSPITIAHVACYAQAIQFRVTFSRHDLERGRYSCALYGLRHHLAIPLKTRAWSAWPRFPPITRKT
jgi:hypothetical protein